MPIDPPVSGLDEVIDLLPEIPGSAENTGETMAGIAWNDLKEKLDAVLQRLDPTNLGLKGNENVKADDGTLPQGRLYAVESLVDISEKTRALKSGLDALNAFIETPDRDRARKLAVLLNSIAGQLFPSEEDEASRAGKRKLNYEDVNNRLTDLAHFLLPMIDLLADKLEIGRPTRVELGSFDANRLFRFPPSPVKALELIEAPGNRLNFWKTGAIPGVEFGFYEIGEGGVRNVRLSPLPLPIVPPPPVFTLMTAYFGPLGMLAGAMAEYGPLLAYNVLYTLFPGYPAFFDVPTEDGVPLTFVPVGRDLSQRNVASGGPLWPGSGHALSVPDGMDYQGILINLQSILSEDFGGLPPELLRLRSGQQLETMAAMASAITNLAGNWPPSNLEDSQLKNLAAPTLQVVRPTAQGFPARLSDPAPLVIGDARRARAFLLTPTRGLWGKPVRQRYLWTASPLYHADAGRFLSTVHRKKLKGLFEAAAAEGEWSREGDRKNGFDDSFVLADGPGDAIERGGCVEGVHYDGPTGGYNWELFYHLPLHVAGRLATDLQFSEADTWLRRVFDPTATQGKAPARYWRFKPLHDEASGGSLDSVDAVIRNADVSGAIERWKANPTDANAVARTRPGAFQRAAVMQTVDMLVAWGDKLFRDGGQEAVNEARLYYDTASVILGERPTEVYPPKLAPRTYNALRAGNAKPNPFGGALVAIENLMPANDVPPTAVGGTTLGSLAGPSMLYFGVPANERLRDARANIDAQLFKIRHSLDIEGRPRTDALSGAVVDGISGQLSPRQLGETAEVELPKDAPPPVYRFTFALQKAQEFCADVRALGGALLGALEKRDGEALALLKSDHETRVLEATTRVRKMQIEEANATLNGLRHTRAGAQIKKRYYEKLIAEDRNAYEIVKEGLAVLSAGFKMASSAAELAAAILHPVPDTAVDGGGGGGAVQATGKGTVTTKFGASRTAAALSAGARALGIVSSVAELGSSLAGTEAAYRRRMQEWVHQRKLADNELNSVDKQIEASETRLSIIRIELENHLRQVDNGREIGRYLREKFTNHELYQWMVGETSRLYLQTYRLAFNLAMEAGYSYTYEHPDDTRSRLTAHTFDKLRQGLLAGEGLQLQLRDLEKAWLEKGAREFEYVKHVSLRLHDPVALIRLRETGLCLFSLPERLFDADYPGQYMRRIKSVSVSIPCVVGPYTSVNCRLTLKESRIRTKTEIDVGYSERPVSDEPRFKYENVARSITTSSGQNDTGLFELNLRDERYLPFEGAGVIGSWMIELPQETNRFDFSTISDLVLHMKYTAKDAQGEGIKKAAAMSVFGHEIGKPATSTTSTSSAITSAVCLSARAEFGAGWSRLKAGVHGSGGHVLEFDLSLAIFPFTPPGKKIRMRGIEAVVIGAGEALSGWHATWSWRDTGVVFEEVQGPEPLDEFISGSDPVRSPRSVRLEVSEAWFDGHDGLRHWRIEFVPPASTPNDAFAATDVLLLCAYDQVSA